MASLVLWHEIKVILKSKCTKNCWSECFYDRRDPNGMQLMIVSGMLTMAKICCDQIIQGEPVANWDSLVSIC